MRSLATGSDIQYRDTKGCGTKSTEWLAGPKMSAFLAARVLVLSEESLNYIDNLLLMMTRHLGDSFKHLASLAAWSAAAIRPSRLLN